ncbi:MAG: YlxR family protein [Microbacteriaceae bacterium]
MESVRTCVGCRVRAERSSLLRVIARDSKVVVDETATSYGRGAWLHPTIECYQAAVRRRAFGRALRVTRELDTTAVPSALEDIVASGSTTREQAERLMDN